MAIDTIDQVAVASSFVLSRCNEYKSAYELLLAASSRQPDSTALSFVPTADAAESATEHWTFSELVDRCRRTSSLLERAGGPNAVVSIVLPALPETHFALWGAQLRGIANPINPMLEPQQMAELMRAAGTTVVVALSDRRGGVHRKAVEAARQVPSLKAIVGVDCSRYGITVPTVDFAAPPPALPVFEFDLDLEPLQAEAGPRRGDDAAAYFHTGGTTSAPKLAVLSHANFAAAALAANAHLDLTSSDVALCGLPLFHINGVSVTGLWPWAAGARVVLLGSQGFRDPGILANFWKLAERFGGTYVSAVPTVYQGLINDAGAQERRAGMRFAIVGAAPLPAQVRSEFESRFNIPMLEGYGLTETTCVVTVGPVSGRVPDAGVGLPLAGLMVRAADLDRQTGTIKAFKAAGEVGTIVVRGPNVFLGYLDRAHNGPAWFSDPEGHRWLDTGDLGACDNRGLWRLAGRSKELIIRGGHNIDPKMIESALSSHPAVALVAAVGRPDARLGEVPVAYAQLRPGSSCTEETLQAFAATVVPERAAIPKSVTVLDALPMTALGKIFKPALVALQIEDVVRGELAAIGVEGADVRAKHDPNRGYVVSIQVPSVHRASINDVRAALARFAFKADVA